MYGEATRVESSINHLKHCLARTILKIKYEACSQDANKARGEAECFISIEAKYFIFHIAFAAML